MVIDVLINSCARPDLLGVSFRSFKKHVKTDYELRYVLLEDIVDDNSRQVLGRRWIEAQNLDKVVYADKKMGMDRFFAPVVALCESDYFFHLEDDNEFITDFYIDPVIDLMKKQDDIVEVILNRGNKGQNVGKRVVVESVPVTEFMLFSVATGIFNTKQVKKVIDQLGWDSTLHEAGSLTPAANISKLKRYILGHGEQHYVHVGAAKKYRKGKWSR